MNIGLDMRAYRGAPVVSKQSPIAKVLDGLSAGTERRSNWAFHPACIKSDAQRLAERRARREKKLAERMLKEARKRIRREERKQRLLKVMARDAADWAARHPSPKAKATERPSLDELLSLKEVLNA